MKTYLVTKESLLVLLADPARRIHVIGHALTVLFNQQTRSERSSNVTEEHNNVGFSGQDAHSGTLTAKYYLAHKTLLPWQVDRWMKDSRGYPRICKYWKQLDEAAKQKQLLTNRVC